MKKRWISLLMVICLIVTLLPVFTAPASADYEFKAATDPTGGTWNHADVTNYKNSTSMPSDAVNNELYYEKNGQYYPVQVVDDPEYFYYAYSSGGSINIYENFTNDAPTTYNWKYGHISAKGDNTSINFFVKYNEDMHAVYFNCYGATGVYNTTLFIYTNERFSSDVTDSTSWTQAKSDQAVIGLYNGSSSPSSDWSSVEDYYHWRWENLPASNRTYSGGPQLYLKGNQSGKKAIIYTDDRGNKLGDVARNWQMNTTSSSAPGSPTYSGTLYYKAKDPEMIEVTDPDPAAQTITVDENTTIWNPARVNQNGFKLSKELSAGTGGTFDLTMQSYSTANTTKMDVTEKVPTDFVVVVDQSGSMSTNDMATGYSTVSGTKTLEDIAAGTYYIKDGSNYYRVYATRDYLMEYFAENTKWTKNIVEDAGYDLSWFQGEEDAEFTQDNQYYYKTSDGIYRPVSVYARGALGAYLVKISYIDANNQEQYFIRPEKPVYKRLGWSQSAQYKEGNLGYSAVNPLILAAYPNSNEYTYSTFIGITTGMFINYPMYTRHVGYTKLCYRDIDGVEHIVNPTSGANVAEYCDSDGNAVTTAGGSTRMNYNKLYTANGTETRLSALKSALNAFVQAVADESDTKIAGQQCTVDNRIAIVGFSSDGYSNTEILTGENLTVSNNNGVQKADASTSDYATALVSANNDTIGSVNPKLTAAINALTANGGTQPEDGFQMANSIFTNRNTTSYQMTTGDHNTVQRNKIVIFFTDGHPGDYQYSDMYAEANDVVESALPLKNMGAAVFSIGVFGESDGNPLTYAHERKTSVDSSWKFLGGWVENYYSSPYYYCLRRQWRPNNAVGYTETANDTIFDYMSVTSSNYPNAEDYIAPAWIAGNFSGNYIAATDGVRHKETATDTNQFYRMAANQATLVEAFKQSVTYASSQQESSSSVSLDTTAVFKDTINTTDFDVSNATYTVEWQPIQVADSADASGSFIRAEGDPIVKVENRAVPANGIIEYSGFDYNSNYVSSAKSSGYKLVVKVKGLVPKTYDETIKSNTDTEELNACGIYEAGKTSPEISVPSPTLTIYKAASTYIADFNAPLIVATEVPEGGITENTSNNGSFERKDGNAVYQLESGKQGDKTAVINGAYENIDSAKVNGKHVEDGASAKIINRTVNVIPGSSVYYSDALTTPVTIGDGIGYNAEIGNSGSQSATNKTGPFYFTFYGTGIDVYCTTHSSGGYVSAAVFRGSGESACVKANREGSAKTIKNYSAENLYNTPSVSFTGLTAGTYTLKITANEGAQYKLDGVRVYDPVQAGSAAATELNKTEEANATYLNLRKVLLNDEGVGGFTVTNDIPTGEIDPSVVNGVLFLDDVSSIVTTYNDEEGNPQQKYASQFDVYKANGPKNEIYLSENQGLTFQMNISKFDENTKVYLGLSAPETGSGIVKINGKAVSPAVNSVMDMYYPVEFDLDNAVDSTLSITITNNGSSLISITNLKITGIEELIPAATSSNQQQVLNATRALFAPVTMKTVRMAANQGVDPEEETTTIEEPATTEEPEVVEEPAETEEPNISEEPGTNGDLVIEEPEDPDTPTPEPTVTPTPKPDNTSAVQKVIQSVTKAISSFFKSIFRR